MSSYIRPSGFNLLPTVTKNLLIINILGFIATLVIQSSFNTNLNFKLGMYYFGSAEFMPIQIITHMFLHADFNHLIYNMFAFWMFGTTVENLWGPKRFLIYYLATGLGAAILHQFVSFIEMQQALSMVPADIAERFIQGESVPVESLEIKKGLAIINDIVATPTIGASGAVFGVLLAFGMLFPNALVYLFFAIPIKAKWLVMGYGLYEIYRIIFAVPGDNVAHFAHLGGMIFGFFLIKFWRKQDLNKQRWY